MRGHANHTSWGRKGRGVRVKKEGRGEVVSIKNREKERGTREEKGVKKVRGEKYERNM